MSKKPKRIRVADIVPGKTYMVRARHQPGAFEPVTVTCDFTQGWLRGWTKMWLDPLWNPNGWRKPVIEVRPLNPQYSAHFINVTRAGDDFYCHSSFESNTLFEYETGWATQKLREARSMIAELEQQVDWLSAVENGDVESRAHANRILWFNPIPACERGV